MLNKKEQFAKLAVLLKTQEFLFDSVACASMSADKGYNHEEYSKTRKEWRKAWDEYSAFYMEMEALYGAEVVSEFVEEVQ